MDNTLDSKNIKTERGKSANLIARLLVEPKCIQLKPQLVLCNSWEETGAGVCQVSISKASVGVSQEDK